jgi:hypothetical protein
MQNRGDRLRREPGCLQGRVQLNRSSVMSDPAQTPEDRQPAEPVEQKPAVCLRCGTPGPVGDDGFCDKCEKALEQACL